MTFPQRKGPTGPPNDNPALPDPSLSPGNLIRANSEGTAYEFLESPSEGTIPQFDSSIGPSGEYVSTTGPGPIARMLFTESDWISEVELCFLYHFPSTEDLSPNGIDLESFNPGTLETMLMFPGASGVYFEVNGALNSIDPTPTPAQRLANIAIFALLSYTSTLSNTTIVTCGGIAEDEANNGLYNFFMPTNDPPRNLSLSWEFGAGNNVVATTTRAGDFAPSLAGPEVVMFLTAVRNIIGGQAFVQFYQDGEAFGALLGPFTPPTGGESSPLIVGGVDGSGATRTHIQRDLMLLASDTYNFTAEDVMRQRNQVLGPCFGSLPLP